MPEQSNVSVSVEEGVPRVTARLVFPGPVVLGVVTSTGPAAGQVSYRRLYATLGGDTSPGSTTGTAVVPELN